MPPTIVPVSTAAKRAEREALEEAIRVKIDELVKLETERTRFETMPGIEPHLTGPITVADTGGCSICIKNRLLRIKLATQLRTDVEAIEVRLAGETSMLSPSNVIQLQSGAMIEVPLQSAAVTTLGTAPAKTEWSVRAWRRSMATWQPLKQERDCDMLNGG